MKFYKYNGANDYFEYMMMMTRRDDHNSKYEWPLLVVFEMKNNIKKKKKSEIKQKLV